MSKKQCPICAYPIGEEDKFCGRCEYIEKWNPEIEQVDELVVHPKHYNQGKYEVKDVIRDWKMNFAMGSAIKYIVRCEYKGDKKRDLEKAIFFLQDEINNMDNK